MQCWLIILSFLGGLLIATGCDGDGSENLAYRLPADVVEENGCGGARFLSRSNSLIEKGPWPVGARTVLINGLIGEIWYPARIGSEAGAVSAIYDIREQLDPEEAAKISDANNPWHYCDCYRGLPLDTHYGPYPVIVFVHGTAGFRHQSLSFMTHWASHGFVVAAVDHPGLNLGDLLALRLSQDLQADLTHLVTALDEPSGELAFLSGSIDMDRIAATGHSAGGRAVEAWGQRARVLIPMAAGGTQTGLRLRSTLILGAMEDAVVDYSGQKSGYEQSGGPKRLVGLSNAGHLAFSDLCLLGVEDGGLVEIAQKAGVSGAQFASLLWDGCDEGALHAEMSIEIVNYVTTAVLREELQCRGRPTIHLPGIRATYPDVGEYLQSIE